jgi:S-adenosylmethionine hydrolase
MRRILSRALFTAVLLAPVRLPAQSALVFQTDFGLSEGSVAEMKGVAFRVSRGIPMFDLTHLIPPYDILEAAVRLRQTVPVWPAGTVFVSVVDPGVGTERRAVVLLTRTGQLVVSPDNGTLTLVADALGVQELRQIDVERNRLPGSERSHTFHGRDVFAYTGARLAAGQLRLEDVGPLLTPEVIRLAIDPPRLEGRVARGAVTTIDRPYGNVWTNLPVLVLDSMGVRLGDTLRVTVRGRGGRVAFQGRVPYVRSFGAVRAGRPLVYLNSLLEVSVALNRADFAGRYGIVPGKGWELELRR